MKKSVNYITIDGRGEHESFRDCVTKKIEELKPNEGIHLIKDFEPFPLYKMMEAKGFDKYIEKISEDEYHAYFTPKDNELKIKMEENINIDRDKIKKIIDIELNFFRGTISKDEAKHNLQTSFEKISPEEFAICEQYLEKYDVSDDLLTEKMEEILEIFEDVLVSNTVELEEGHPIKTYLLEVSEIRKILKKMNELLQKKFIKNEWCEVYEKLSEINIHFSRKQNQLYTALEMKGFDKPSKVMWTLENDIRDIIKRSKEYLKEDKDQNFLSIQNEVIEMVEDMMVKEEEILYPTSLEILHYEDFVKMRRGDDEIGYCLIENPSSFGDVKNIDIDRKDEFMKDLSELLMKHGVMSASDDKKVLAVSEGKLTLEQINLIFKHLNVDLSYVDENNIVKFYSDTKHRVFPRSAGVIGREVQNCHPRESVSTVEEIIRAFKSGEQDKAEFWLEINDKFIYIIYNAVRNDNGEFKGILEMMQDVTHIRSLKGSQRLISWNTNTLDDKKIKDNNKIENSYGINANTNVGKLVKEYPYIKEFLVGLSPKFSKLKNPVLFKTMSSMATIEMISTRGGFEVHDLINKIVKEIDNK